MNVEAVRDDGALLICDGPAALIVAAGRAWLTSRDSALSRGNWEPSEAPVPDDVQAEDVGRLGAYRDELNKRESLPGE